MKTWFRVLTAITVLGLVWMAGCEKPRDLTLQRSRIFLMGRLLVGKTCDVRLIWRKAPNDPQPVSVTADLSQIGGSAAQDLTADNHSIWRWAGQVVPAAAGEKTLRITALDSDDKEYESRKAVQVHAADARAIAVDCGAAQSFALKPAGTVVDWQTGLAADAYYVKCENPYIEPEPPPADLSDVVAISAGYDRNLALRADGTIVSWNVYNIIMYGHFDVPDHISDVVAIAAGKYCDFALKADGTVMGWPDNASIGLTIPGGLSDVIALAAADCAYALRADGTVVSWLAVPDYARWEYTEDACAVPQGLEDVVAVDPGIALKADGSVAMLNSRYKIPRRAGNFRAKAVAAGIYHWMALFEDGTVMIWWVAPDNPGLPLYYVSDERLEHIIAIADGHCNMSPPNSMALTADGRVLAWDEWWDGQHELSVPAELQ